MAEIKTKLMELEPGQWTLYVYSKGIKHVTGYAWAPLRTVEAMSKSEARVNFISQLAASVTQAEAYDFNENYG